MGIFIRYCKTGLIPIRYRRKEYEIKLSRYEQEVVINLNADEDEATAYAWLALSGEMKIWVDVACVPMVFSQVMAQLFTAEGEKSLQVLELLGRVWLLVFPITALWRFFYSNYTK